MLDFSIRSLEVFYAVAKYGSFTIAAEELYISQSSVSKIIGRLELILGIGLFERNSHSVALTPAGQYLYKELDKFLPTIETTFQKLDAFKYQVEENICLSLPYSVGKRLASNFTKDYPNIHLSISQNYDSFLAFNSLISNDVSLWITHSLLIPEDYKKHINIFPIYSDPVYAVLPAAHPLAGQSSIHIRDIRRETIICHSLHTMAAARALSINSGHKLNVVDMRDSIATRAACLVAISSGEGISLFYKSDFEMLSSRKVVSIPIEEGQACMLVAAYEKSKELEEYEVAFLNNFAQYWEVL